MSGRGRLLPRAPLGDVLAGRARWVGSRLDPDLPRGFASPIDARVHLGVPYGDLARAEHTALPTASTLRTLLASVLTSLLGTPDGAHVRRPHLVSSRVDNFSIDEAISFLTGPAPRERARVVHFVHPHALNVAASDPQLREDLAQADAVLPDGIGLRIAGRLLGTPLVHNLNGTDLLPEIVEVLRRSGRPLALIGGAPKVAETCAKALRERAPELRIVRTSHGFLDDEAARGLATALAGDGGPLVLVAMGSPIQERFARRYFARIPGATVVTVGGLFDFYSGRLSRAPIVLRELGLEWTWRLSLEPRRLARRYLVGNPLFLLRVLRQRLLGGAGRSAFGLDDTPSAGALFSTSRSSEGLGERTPHPPR